MKHCSCHASCCGRHFSSLGAFDAHRKNGVCTDPREVKGLRPKTKDGLCDQIAPPQVGVVIWELGSQVDRARQQFTGNEPLRETPERKRVAA